jgi:hypothetical protein
MVDLVDPLSNDKSYLFEAVFFGMATFTLIDVMLFAGSAIKFIRTVNVLWLLLCLITLILAVAIPYFWYVVAGNQTRFDNTVNQYKFNKGVKNKEESFSKYDKTVPEKTIREFTGFIEFYEGLGICKEEINETSWSLKDHPYTGNYSLNLLADANFLDEDEVFIENMFEANKNIPAGCLKKTSMVCGQTLSNILEDIEKQLADPNLPKVREQALYSLYNQYSGRNATFEPLYIIHIGLPYAPTLEIAIENMTIIRNEFERSINEKKIHTTLITNSDDIIDIINGIFTGTMWFRGDVIDN